MGFFPDAEVVAKTTPTEFDCRMATGLRAIVVAFAGRVRPWRKTAWADEFRILRQELAAGSGAADPERRVIAVLQWYGANFNNPTVPQLLSAAAFRRHFDWVERLTARDGAAALALAGQTESARATAAALYLRLRGRQWGKGETGLESSINRAVAAHAALMETLSPLRDDRHVGPFLRWVWGRLAAESFLFNWYEEVWQRTVKWEAWSGTFGAFEFKPGSAAADAKLVGWAAEYGDARFWPKVVATLLRTEGDR